MPGLVDWAALIVAFAFMLGALSLAGVPPLSGFVAKLGVVTAALAEGDYLAGAVAVVTSLATLLVMLRIWSIAFWGEPPWHRADPGALRPTRARGPVVVPALALALPSIVFGVGAQPLLSAADSAAAGLLDLSTYIAAVAR